MVKPILLISNFCMLLSLLSCSKVKFDTVELDSYNNDLIQWITAPSDTNVLFVDSNGLAQTITICDYYENSSDVIETDDYGNSYGSFNKEITYISSISNIRLFVSSNGYSYGEDDGFQLRFNYSTNNVWAYKKAMYDFDQPDQSSNCERFDSLLVDGQMYDDMINVTFDNMKKDTDIRSFYYSKEFGLVGFMTNVGVLVSIK